MLLTRQHLSDTHAHTPPSRSHPDAHTTPNERLNAAASRTARPPRTDARTRHRSPWPARCCGLFARNTDVHRLLSLSGLQTSRGKGLHAADVGPRPRNSGKTGCWSTSPRGRLLFTSSMRCAPALPAVAGNSAGRLAAAPDRDSTISTPPDRLLLEYGSLPTTIAYVRARFSRARQRRAVAHA
jgi:hypothetical protein